MLSRIKTDKKAVSEMVGYVLLVTLVVTMGVLVYAWVKTYVPTATIECPDDVSIFIEDVNCTDSILKLNIKNTGMFNIAGYFIKATSNPTEELATIDLSPNLTSEGNNASKAVLFLPENSVQVGDEKTSIFNLQGQVIYSIEITPVRFQEIDNKIRFVSCSEATIKKEVNCIGTGPPH